MTHRGPFQPLPFRDSVVLSKTGTYPAAAVLKAAAVRLAGQLAGKLKNLLLDNLNPQLLPEVSRGGC